MPDATSCVCIAILREPALDAAAQERVLAGNRELFERARALGGTLYPYAALALTREDLRRHYADQWPALQAAKRQHDPDDVLASGPDLQLAAS